MLGAAGGAIGFLALGAGLAFRRDSGVDLALWSAAGLSLVTVALTVAAFMAARDLIGPAPGRPGRPATGWLAAIAALPLSVLAAWLAYDRGILAPLLGAAGLTGLSVLPVGLVVWTVRRLGPPIRALRAWGQFTSGLTWMPALALMLEFAALLPLLAMLGFWMASTTDGAAFVGLLERLPANDPDAARLVIERLLQSPLALSLVYAYIALLVPLIEEGIKTMAVWPFLRGGLSPAAAFLGGSLGGAGYALFEALFLIQPGDDWPTTTAARAGATLLHAFTAGLTSIGLAKAASSPLRRGLPALGVAYSVSVVMHSSWNLAALTLGLASIPPSIPVGTLAEIAAWTPLVLLGLSVLSLAGLLLAWRRLPPAVLASTG